MFLLHPRARDLLTAAGMACGVFALVLMSAMATHFSTLARHFQRTFAARVYVCEKPTFWAGGGILAADRVSVVARAPGVASVIPILVGRLQPRRMIILGLPQVLVGAPAARAAELWRDAPLATGRWLGAQDEGRPRAMLGSEVALTLDAAAGAPVQVLGQRFDVVGVLARTGALEDHQMLVPLGIAQTCLARRGLLTGMVVTPAVPAAAEAVAAGIHQRLPGAEAISPSRMVEEVADSLRTWNGLALGAGLVAAITGTLCIAITMGVAVRERTHDIGLKKAVGASRAQIAGEFLTESGLLAVLGWAVGAALAVAFVAGWDAAFRREGLFLFSITPGVLLRSFATAVTLGLVAGTVPALAAAGLDPVGALRSRL